MNANRNGQRAALVLTMLSAAAAMPAFADPVNLVNAGFEAGWTGTSDPSYPLFQPGYIASPTGPDVGWTFHTGTVDAAGVTLSNTLWGGVAAEGAQFAWLQGSDPSDPFGASATYLEQSFNIASGGAYILRFDQANRADYSSGNPSTLAVAIDGTTVGTFTTATQTWVPQSQILQNLSVGTHELAFTNITPLANGDETAYLDAVSITPVPEPAQTHLLLGGLALLALVGMRRARVQR